MATRISNNRLDYLAYIVYKGLKEHPHVEVRNPDGVVSIVRKTISENLKTEADCEREAETMLRDHRAKILQDGADYRKMLRDGTRALAKKKGVVI